MSENFQKFEFNSEVMTISKKFSAICKHFLISSLGLAFQVSTLGIVN